MHDLLVIASMLILCGGRRIQISMSLDRLQTMLSCPTSGRPIPTSRAPAIAVTRGLRVGLSW